MGGNKEDSVMEKWRDIPGCDGYMVSDLGRVKSLGNDKSRKEKILKPGKDRNGYLQVGLWKDGKLKRHFIHRLVWEAFNGPIPEGYEINHINERPWDARLENLNLMTHKENINYGTRNRKVAKALRKMVEQYTLEGTHICTWFSVRGIEKELGYNNVNISRCCNGKLKTAYGYIWKYAE